MMGLGVAWVREYMYAQAQARGSDGEVVLNHVSS